MSLSHKRYMLGILSHKLFSSTVVKDHKSSEDLYYFQLSKHTLKVISKDMYTIVMLYVILKSYHF